jgi:hypothetical protein
VQGYVHRFSFPEEGSLSICAREWSEARGRVLALVQIVIAVWGFFTSPLGKIAGIAAAVAAGLLALGIWFHAHDARIRTQDAAAIAAKTQAIERADAAKAITALEADAALAAKRAAILSDQKSEVSHAPDAEKPVDDPAVLRALCLLRADCPGGGQAASP